MLDEDGRGKGRVEGNWKKTARDEELEGLIRRSKVRNSVKRDGQEEKWDEEGGQAVKKEDLTQREAA